MNEPALAIRFPGTDEEGLDRIDWETFFERFDEEALAFAHATDTEGSGVDYALIDRERASEFEGDPGDAPADVDERDQVREDQSTSGARRREAMDDAIADAHRDEPPFTSE